MKGIEKKTDENEMTEIEKNLQKDNYNQYIGDLSGNDKEIDAEQAQARRQLIDEMR